MNKLPLFLMTTGIVAAASIDASAQTANPLSKEFHDKFGSMVEDYKEFNAGGEGNRAFIGEYLGKKGSPLNAYIAVTAITTEGYVTPNQVTELKVYRRDKLDTVSMVSVTRGKDGSWNVFKAQAADRNGGKDFNITSFREEDWKETGRYVVTGDLLSIPDLYTNSFSINDDLNQNRIDVAGDVKGNTYVVKGMRITPTN